MKQIKTWLTTIAVLLCSGTIKAASYDFEIDGICYYVNNKAEKTLTVTYNKKDYYSSEQPYSGDIVIPSEVVYEGDKYIVTEIGQSAFDGDTEVTSITLPSTLTKIASTAFRYCKFKSIVIPKNVQKIENNAFSFCSELREAFFMGRNYPELGLKGWGSDTPFRNTHISLKLYVINKEEALKVETWSEFYSDIVVEYVSFDQNEFDYNGQVPTVAYTNNLSNKYELTMDVSDLSKDAGIHETTFSAVYSNGLEVDIPYTYTINKAPLTINVNDAEKIYGDENPQFTYSLSGFVNNEDESVLNSAVAFSTKANKKSGAGTYSVSASATAKNYEVGCTEGTLTVKKAPVTVAVNAKSRVYGDANPQFDFTYVGLKNGDGVPVFTSEITTSTKATRYSDAGNYEVTVSGGVATNYSFTEYIPGILTITPAPLNISVQSTVREYGDANPEFQFAYSGFKNDDDADCLTTPPTVVTSATPTSSVGEYEITPNGAEATNYVISYTNGTLTVNKAPLTILAENAERVYGDENPKFTFAYSG